MHVENVHDDEIAEHKSDVEDITVPIELFPQSMLDLPPENKDLNEKRLRHEGKIRNLQEDIKRSEIDCQRLNDELQAYRRETEMVVEQRQELDASRQRMIGEIDAVLRA